MQLSACVRWLFVLLFECARQAEDTVRVAVVVDVAALVDVVRLRMCHVHVLHSVSVCKLVER